MVSLGAAGLRCHLKDPALSHFSARCVKKSEALDLALYSLGIAMRDLSGKNAGAVLPWEEELPV